MAHTHVDRRTAHQSKVEGLARRDGERMNIDCRTFDGSRDIVQGRDIPSTSVTTWGGTLDVLHGTEDEEQKYESAWGHREFVGAVRLLAVQVGEPSLAVAKTPSINVGLVPTWTATLRVFPKRITGRLLRFQDYNCNLS